MVGRAAAVGPGDRLGPYRVDAILGGGASGVVVRATRLGDGATVAIKVFGAFDGDDALRRVFHEARAGSALEHPHIVRVLDIDGMAHAPAYLVMELLPGGSLADRLLAHGPLPVREVVQLVGEIGAALDGLHTAGFLHRDIKPSNVLFRDDGSSVLADLGLVGGQALSAVTIPGHVLGTIDYLAPEVVRGGDATRASDVYALGCLVYECLTGHPPFADRSALDVARAHADQAPAPLTSQRVDVSAAIGDVALLALAKRPDDRPPTATAYARLLRAAELE